MFSKNILLSFLFLALAVHSAQATLRLGLAWGTDNTWAKTIAKGNVDWYWHWQEGPVSTMPSSVSYVPNYWGPKYSSEWAARKKEMAKSLPSRLLAQNEPDVAGQSNLSPTEAASLWIKELLPYQKKGVKVSSPQIVWDVSWMDSFMKKLKADGADPDFMAVHWYGSYTDISGLKSWVEKIHKRYGKSVWLTEYGVTASSNPSAAQIKAFHIEATEWLKSTGYVKRAAWLGCYAYSDPPDSYPSKQNAFFNDGGSLRSLANFYIYSGAAKRDTVPAIAGASAPSRRTPGALRHSQGKAHRSIAEKLASEDEELVRRAEEAEAWARSDEVDEDESDDIEEGEADHCDEICKSRNKALAAASDDTDVMAEGDEEDESLWVD